MDVLPDHEENQPFSVVLKIWVPRRGRSLLQRDPTECMSLSVITCNNDLLHLQWLGRRCWTKKERKFGMSDTVLQNSCTRVLWYLLRLLESVHINDFYWSLKAYLKFFSHFHSGFGYPGFKSPSEVRRPCAVFVVFSVFVVKRRDITWNYPTPLSYTYFPNLCCQLSCIIRYPILQVCLYYQLLCSWSRVLKDSLNKPRMSIYFGNWQRRKGVTQ